MFQNTSSSTHTLRNVIVGRIMIVVAEVDAIMGTDVVVVVAVVVEVEVEASLIRTTS